MSQPPLTTVIIFRRSYGLRYTDLPVDSLDQDALVIRCADSLLRPEHYDLCTGDMVRWRQGERFVEAVINTVRRDPDAVQVELVGAHLLPPEFFPY